MPKLRNRAATFIKTCLAGLLLGSASLAAAVTECDRLAGHKLDPDSVVAGISRSGMDMQAAEKACREAVAAYPAHARSNYQLGRVLYYSGRGKESLPYLEVAADAGYPQAIFVLGFVKTLDGDGIPVDYCGAADLWLKSAALDHPWTGVYLPWEYLQGNFADCDRAFQCRSAAPGETRAGERVRRRFRGQGRGHAGPARQAPRSQAGLSTTSIPGYQRGSQ